MRISGPEDETRNDEVEMKSPAPHALGRLFARPGGAFGGASLALCMTIALSHHANANAGEVLDRGSIEIGIGASELGGQVAVDGSTGALGTDVDLSRDLDVGGRDRSRLYALRWRPFDRHEFSVRAQRFGRSGDRTISRDIVFDDEVFTINSRVEGSISLDVLTVDYTGWLIADEQRAFGLSIGALQYRLGLSLGAENLPGGVQPEPIEAEVSEDLPVLVLGAEYREQLSHRWRLIVRGAVFKAQINSIDGTVYDVDAGLEYAFTDHLALALRYSATRLDAETSRADLTGRLRLDLSGLQSTLSWRW